MVSFLITVFAMENLFEDPPSRELAEWEDRRKKITENQKAWIISSRADGATLRWCAKKLGVTPAAVWRVVKKSKDKNKTEEAAP